jgi:sugar phosphate isomerase/epimerase
VKLGLCSIAALDRPLAEVAAAAAEAGADGLEVTARPPHVPAGADEAALHRIGNGVRAAGLDVLAYGSYLGHGDHREADARREVAHAAALGTGLLRVWAPLRTNEPDAGFGEIVALLGCACDAARECGIEVVVERHIGSFADTPERTLRLLDAVGRPNFALNYQVCDFLEPAAADEQPEDARRLASHARYVHLKNYVPGAAAGGRLVHGGSLAGGVLDYTRLLAAIVETGYDGPMSVEFLSAEPLPLADLLASDLRFVRDTLASLGALPAGVE